MEKSRIIHENKYDYSKVIYINNYTKVEIICHKHGSFFTQPSSHIFKKTGCQKCAKIRQSLLLTKSQKEFIEKAQTIHGDKYDYSKSIYISSFTKIEIICKKENHGAFHQQASNHLFGKGCPKCGCKGNLNRNTEQFIQDAIKIHGNKYDYSKTVFTKTKNKIIISCKTHGDFIQNSGNHLRGVGCKKCWQKVLQEKGNNWKYSTWQTSAEKK